MKTGPRRKKSLGQHFLRDTNMIHKIVSSIPAQPGDKVVEIGPGDGALTEYLSERFDDISAVEIDPVMIDHLQKKLPDLHLIKQDILKTDWSGFARKGRLLHVVGNLPYFITSQILFALLKDRSVLTSATLMMQKEVAERIVAEPGSKQYGILSVQTQLMSSPEILFDVPAAVFSPPPKVTSSIIRLTFDQPELACSDSNLKTVVRMAFNQRRKKLSNALKRLNAELPAKEFNFDLRAEALEPAMYEKLTARLEQLDTFN